MKGSHPSVHIYSHPESPIPGSSGLKRHPHVPILFSSFKHPPSKVQLLATWEKREIILSHWCHCQRAWPDGFRSQSAAPGEVLGHLRVGYPPRKTGEIFRMPEHCLTPKRARFHTEKHPAFLQFLVPPLRKYYPHMSMPAFPLSAKGITTLRTKHLGVHAAVEMDTGGENTLSLLCSLSPYRNTHPQSVL